MSLTRIIRPGNLYWDTHNINNTILILGSARSGTTWISHLLNYNNDYRYIFEPFHPSHCPYMSSYPKRWYIPAGTENEEYHHLIKTILSGQIRNIWVDRFNGRYFSTKRIIKSTRAHFMLEWLLSEFPQINLLYILRHPLAVIASRMAYYNQSKDSGWTSVSDLNLLINNDKLIHDYLETYLPILQKADSDFEKQVCFWCVQNAVSLDQLKGIQHHLVFYESVVLDPVSEVSRIYKEMEISVSRFNSQKLLAESKKEYMKIDGSDESTLEKWEKLFTPEQKAYLDNVLSLFGLDKYYTSSSPMPKMSL